MECHTVSHPSVMGRVRYILKSWTPPVQELSHHFQARGICLRSFVKQRENDCLFAQSLYVGRMVTLILGESLPQGFLWGSPWDMFQDQPSCPAESPTALKNFSAFPSIRQMTPGDCLYPGKLMTSAAVFPVTQTCIK